MKKLLLFDLDGTLLRNDKTLSDRTISSLNMCKDKGYMVGISTSRSEHNCIPFLKDICPDILISSGGALIKKDEHYIYKAVFEKTETDRLITTAREICGNDIEITIDTIKAHYWNYKVDPNEFDKSWGDCIWNDFNDFFDEALKICFEIFEEDKANKLMSIFNEYDSIRFSEGYWYKFTKKNVTKENALKIICDRCDLSLKDVVSFGDDLADLEMLRISGVGVAMGNALKEVKEIADVVIGNNDEDGIAYYIDDIILCEDHVIYQS